MTDPNHTACSPIAVPRRAALSLGFAAVVGLAAAAVARAEAGGIKITALYGNPKNPEEFEKYYAETHMPLVYDVKEIKRTELAVGIPGPDGKAATTAKFAHSRGPYCRNGRRAARRFDSCP